MLVNLIAITGWPEWTLSLICVLVLATALLYLLNVLLDKSKPSNFRSNWSFRAFQAQYLTTYLVIMLADWLQGTNMYTLYASYGVNIGALFLTGFLSSALIGTFLGIYVDRLGRKFSCIIFCVLEIVINLIEHVPNIYALLIGRILGGLSTSLLFTAFESWMVTEHRKRKFKEQWLANTFSIISWSNGLIAIVAGFFAQVAADKRGDIGPFQLAIALTVLALLLILPWRENYGGDAQVAKEKESAEGSEHVNGAVAEGDAVSFRSGWQYIVQHPDAPYLGLSQAFFEGGVFTFVFMWVPTLLITNPYSDLLPTGLIFSAFMLSMTIGGLLFSAVLLAFPGAKEEWMCVAVYGVAAAAMVVPILSFHFWSILVSFLALEMMLGIFNSCGGILRSRVYPTHMQSTIMSIFRVPLNILVVIGTLLTNQTGSSIFLLQCVFGVVVSMFVVAFVLQLLLCRQCTERKSL